MQGDFAPVHDPCIIKQGDTYYVFSTSVKTDTAGFIACRRSRDLVNWERAGFVFTQIPEWARDAVPRTKGIWAPDISFFNGLYHLYYSVSSLRFEPFGDRPRHEQYARSGGARLRMGR